MRVAGIAILSVPALTAALSFQNVGKAVVLKPGDIVVTARIETAIPGDTNSNWGLLRIDPATGDRTVISDDTHGAGIPFDGPYSVSPAPDGTLLVNDVIRGLFKVDPATGDRVRLVGRLSDIDAVQVENTILVSNPGSPNLVGYDASTMAGRPGYLGGFGSNPRFSYLSGMASYGAGVFAAGVVNSGFDNYGGIVYIDVATGHGTLVSGIEIFEPITVGAGPYAFWPLDLAVDHRGQLLMTTAEGMLLRVDPTTGDRTVVSTPYASMQNQFQPSASIAVGADDRIFVAGQLPNPVVMAIDPMTGFQTILSDSTHGFGPQMIYSYGIMVVPAVPEPSSVALAAVGAIALFTYRRIERSSRSRR